MTLDNIFNNEKEKPLDNLLDDGGYTAIFRTIACVGDSLASGEFESLKEDGTSGYHDMFEYSWGQYIARMCTSKVYNFSRGGMTTKEYCDSFAEAKDFWNPDYAAQCYIIALGVNDINGNRLELGTIDDIDTENWKNNKENFAGYYGQIISRLKEIQPRAKFFLMSMPKSGNPEEDNGKRAGHRDLLCQMAEKFDNTYVIDLLKYAPVYDDEFKNKFFMRGHMNPMGYLLTAKMVASYIDYIIRHNMDDFKEVGFIGTDLHS